MQRHFWKHTVSAGLDALNVAVNGLTALERHFVLKGLEKIGGRFGYVWSPP